MLHDTSVVNPATRRWEGALPDTVRAWRLSTTNGGSAGFEGWVDEQGRIVRISQLLGLTLEARPYEVAFQNWKTDEASRGESVTADRDIYETTAVSARKPLRSNLRQLRVALSGVELSEFDVKGYRQQLVGDTLTITREDSSALHAAYRLPGGARSTMMALFLDAEPLLEVRESGDPAPRAPDPWHGDRSTHRRRADQHMGARLAAKGDHVRRSERACDAARTRRRLQRAHAALRRAGARRGHSGARRRGTRLRGRQVLLPRVAGSLASATGSRSIRRSASSPPTPRTCASPSAGSVARPSCCV